MTCSEKEDLQLKCTAALSAYQAAVKDLDLPIDLLTGTILSRSFKKRKATEFPLDLKTGQVKQPYLDVMTLHRAYRDASKALSRHLSTHRC